MFNSRYQRWEFIKEIKKVRKKERKQELDKESDQEKKRVFFFSWSLSCSSFCFLSFFLVFLITFLVEYLFSCFLTFLFSFIKSHLRVPCIPCQISRIWTNAIGQRKKEHIVSVPGSVWQEQSWDRPTARTWSGALITKNN